jgi:hypothetical protein
VLCACPNGGFRNAREAAILKAEGVISGVADLFLMCTAKGCSGLFIEMKTSSGRQSKAQIEFESKCIRFGYKYAICRSVEEFIKIINKYIS